MEEDRSCFGFVIDGCRSREQAERIRGVLDRVKLKLTLVVPLGVSEVAARRRLASRLVHAATGRVYSADTVAGASGGIPHSSSNGDAEHSGTALVDAATGDKLERRKDDQDEEVIATRFKAYEERKGDLLTYERLTETWNIRVFDFLHNVQKFCSCSRGSDVTRPFVAIVL